MREGTEMSEHPDPKHAWRNAIAAWIVMLMIAAPFLWAIHEVTKPRVLYADRYVVREEVAQETPRH